MKNLVTIDFTVVPVPYTDHYDIVIEQTFVTNVLAPVLVVEPPVTSFYEVEPGFETTVFLKVSNYGLVDLRDVRIHPDYIEGASSIPLITYIPRLHAMESIEVPFKVSYWGTQGEALPPGGSDFAKCFDDCMKFHYDKKKFMQQLDNMIDGSGLCGISKAILKAIVHGLMQIHHLKGGPTPYTDPGYDTSVIKMLGCAIGCDNKANWKLRDDAPASEPVMAPYTRAEVSDGGSGCFAGGTPVLMANGTRLPIEDVHVGDRVMAFNGKAGHVRQIYIRKSDHVRELRYRILDNETGDGAAGTQKKPDLRRLKTTDEHLFWLKDCKRWVAARDLKPGDMLIMANARTAKLTETSRTDTPVLVYSLAVDKYYSYFANGVLIRQKCGGNGETGIEEKLIKTLGSENPWSESQEHNINKQKSALSAGEGR